MTNNKAIKYIRKNAVSKLIGSSILLEEAKEEVDILLGFVAGITKKDFIIHPDRELSDTQVEKLENLINKRIENKIPVQYLTNKAYFMGDKYYVDNRVLIPRPETELLVLEAINIYSDNFYSKKTNIIDIGTGSGCIICAITKHIKSSNNIINFYATDISEDALDVAKHNAGNLGLNDRIKFIQSDLFSSIDEQFSIIISNPPYIPIIEKSELQVEVARYEPQQALFAQDDLGISVYTELIKQSKTKLEAGGYLLLEIGINQSALIKDLINKNNLKLIKIVKDLSNVDRVIIAQS